MPTEKNIESLRLDAGETDLPELESAQPESLDFEFQEVDSLGYESQGFGFAGLETAGFESVEIESIESVEIEPVEIESVDLDSWEVGTESRLGGLEGFDLSGLEIEDHVPQGVTFGGGYDPYNQTRSMNHRVGKTGGGTRR